MKGVQKGVVTAKFNSCITINMKKVQRKLSVNEKAISLNKNPGCLNLVSTGYLVIINLHSVERKLNNNEEMLKWSSKANIKKQTK